MPLQLCPTATVAAPVERIWALLADPRRYGEWWDARTERITPEGPAIPGQQIEATSRALGRRWPVHISVEAVDAARRRIQLLTRLPFGLTIRNTISISAVSEETAWLQFGWDVLPPPGWRRFVFERLLAGAIARDVERAMQRLKRAAEAEALA